MPVSVTLSDPVVVSDDVLVQEVGDELVLLDLAGEHYFGLDQVGTRIWELLGQARSLQQVHAQLCSEFDAEPARIEADLLGLVGELSEAGLLRIEQAAGG